VHVTSLLVSGQRLLEVDAGEAGQERPAATLAGVVIGFILPGAVEALGRSRRSES